MSCYQEHEAMNDTKNEAMNEAMNEEVSKQSPLIEVMELRHLLSCKEEDAKGVSETLNKVMTILKQHST